MNSHVTIRLNSTRTPWANYTSYFELVFSPYIFRSTLMLSILGVPNTLSYRNLGEERRKEEEEEEETTKDQRPKGMVLWVEISFFLDLLLWKHFF